METITVKIKLYCSDDVNKMVAMLKVESAIESTLERVQSELNCVSGRKIYSKVTRSEKLERMREEWT